MELLHPVNCVADEELTYILVEVSENKTAGYALIGKVKAVVVILVGRIRVRDQIEEIQAVTIAVKGACMIIDHIKYHSDSVDVKNVDHHFQLRHRTAEIRLIYGRFSPRSEQIVHLHEM